MRKFLIVCLLASATAPAFARPNDADDQRSERPRGGNSSADDDSGPRASAPRAERRERSLPGGFGRGSSSDSPRFERGERPEMPVERPRFERRERADLPLDDLPGRSWRGERRQPDEPRLSRDGVGAPDERRARVRDWRAEERRVRNPAEAEAGEVRRQRWARDRRIAQPYDGEWNERVRGRVGRRIVPVEGTPPPPVRIARDDRDSPRNHWRGDWRSDHRYDWRRHRDRNRSIFHIGVYFDPFGWNYRRHNVGWRLWPDYYSSSYWIHDPWMYRLPAAYPGTRWIRYHDDALLVDTWSGEVIDVIYSFFW